ncbi:MAG TPA: hypothetical protein VFG90_01190 [Nitrososphaeraceae archaeon]|nr:hypothetical protein [Nitrososphaeraceae archaeon]
MPNGHQLLPRGDSHRGLGYQALIADWMTWLVMENPDYNNDGPVVYLRGLDFTPASGSYSNFIRTGTDRFVIGLDQAIFWPLIMYFVDEKHHQNAENAHKRLLQVTNLMNNGQVPVENDAKIKYNNGPWQPISNAGYADYRFISDREVDLELASQEYDNPKNLCPYFDVPLIHSGLTRCRVAGYFLLLTFNQEGKYTIMSHGVGEMNYRTNTLVEIEVMDQARVNASRMVVQVQKTWKATHP